MSDIHCAVLDKDEPLVDGFQVSKYFSFGYSLRKLGLRETRGGSEFKYWPTLDEIIGEIGKEAVAVKTYTRDNNLRPETVGQRYSNTLFWKALHNEIDEGKKAYINRIPPSFNMTNQALATLTNCLLELREDEWATAATVNSFKGNLRNSMKVNE